jgi:hypothetical protein
LLGHGESTVCGQRAIPDVELVGKIHPKQAPPPAPRRVYAKIRARQWRKLLFQPEGPKQLFTHRGSSSSPLNLAAHQRLKPLAFGVDAVRYLSEISTFAPVAVRARSHKIQVFAQIFHAGRAGGPRSMVPGAPHVVPRRSRRNQPF